MDEPPERRGKFGYALQMRLIRFKGIRCSTTTQLGGNAWLSLSEVESGHAAAEHLAIRFDVNLKRIPTLSRGDPRSDGALEPRISIEGLHPTDSPPFKLEIQEAPKTSY